MTEKRSNLDLELSALMCSRVCHDVISPVGAITNGLEVLADEHDEEMREVAFDLIKKSAEQASAKLQFARLAFGAAGSAGAQIDLGEAEIVVRGFVGKDKVALSWQVPQEARPKDEVKLLLNLILIGLTTIPRGGNMSVSMQGGILTIACEGQGARLPEQTGELLGGSLDLDQVDARNIQLYLAGRIAGNLGLTLDLTAVDDRITLCARPKASQTA